MKKNEIEIGKVYTKEKGEERKVLDIGPQYALWEYKKYRGWLRYEVVSAAQNKQRLNKQYNMSIEAFARWAKYVKVDEEIEKGL